MKITTKYIIKEIMPFFLIGLALFTMVLFVGSTFKRLPSLIQSKLPVGDILSFFQTSIIVNMGLTFPMAILMGVIVAYGRLSGAYEIVALRSSGISPFVIFVPAYIVGFLGFIFLVAYYDLMMPANQKRAKELIISIKRKRPTIDLPAGVFNQMAGTIRSQKICFESQDEKKGIIYFVQIIDSSKPDQKKIIFAKQGKWDRSAEEEGYLGLILYDAVIIEDKRTKEKDPKLNETLCKRLKINIKINVNDNFEWMGDQGYSINQLTEKAKPQKRTLKVIIDGYNRAITNELQNIDRSIANIVKLNTINTNENEKKRLYTLYKKEVVNSITRLVHKKDKIASLQSWKNNHPATSRLRSIVYEINRRFALPFACFIFALLGAPMGTITRRSGIGIGFGLSVVIILVYYGLMVLGNSLGMQGVLSPIMGAWFPNIVFSIIVIIITIKKAIE